MEHRDNAGKTERARLLAITKERHPRLPADDLVQDAFVYVQENNPGLQGAARFAALQNALKVMSATDKYRRGTSVQEFPHEIAPWQTLQMRPRSRPPHLPRTPKGLVRVVKPGSHIEHIPIHEGDPPTPMQAFMAQRIYQEVLAPILNGTAVSSDRLETLADSYNEFFGAPPEHAWARVLVDEIAEAKKARLSHQSMNAARTRPALVQTENAWSVTLRATEKGREDYPQFLKERQIPVRPVWVHKTDAEAIVELWGELEDGKPQVLGQLLLTAAEWNYSDSHQDEAARAHIVLLRAIGKTLQMAPESLLPPYVIDHELITWMIDRMGFEGGGGPNHVSATTLSKWLVSPQELADELERYGRLLADRQGDDEAKRTECKFLHLAKRVRSA